MAQDADVFVAADKSVYELLIREFPTVKFITFSGLNIKYPPPILFFPFMFVLFPRMIWQIFREHRFLEELIEEYGFDIVISDNRYGLWNHKVKTVFMTHQVVVKTHRVLGFLNTFIFAISKYFIQKYSLLWIPDVEGARNFAGDLAHSYIIKRKTRFIGILSRFKNPLIQENSFKYDICVIISGPEPQRTLFEELMIREIEKTSLKAVVVLGIVDRQIPVREFKNGIIYPHLRGSRMEEVIAASEMVISRSGYTTIMDLAVMGKRAIFVPTPGQTEQEYLAERLMKMGLVYYQAQRDFDLKRAMVEAEKYNGLAMDVDLEALSRAVKELLD